MDKGFILFPDLLNLLANEKTIVNEMFEIVDYCRLSQRNI